MNRETLVEEILASIRPAMQADGGDVQLVAVQDGVVSVRLRGMCLCCPSASLTLKHGIERTLRDRLDWVTGVIRVT
jgi:Fe-S cluster biogenesis protein NfuA